MQGHISFGDFWTLGRLQYNPPRFNTQIRKENLHTYAIFVKEAFFGGIQRIVITFHVGISCLKIALWSPVFSSYLLQILDLTERYIKYHQESYEVTAAGYLASMSGVLASEILHYI